MDYASFLTIPLTFIANNPACNAISAQAPSCSPHAIHIALLRMNIQNPKIRRGVRFEPTKNAAHKVTTMAGHCSKSIVIVTLLSSGAPAPS